MDKSTTGRLSIISLWAGILVPIFAMLIPYGIGWLSPDYSLTYKIDGPITVKGRDALAITIKNDGKDLEENIVISIKRSGVASRYPEAAKNRKEPMIFVDSETPITITEDEGKYNLSAGNLRPDDKFTINIMVVDAMIYTFSKEDSITVKSAKHVAHIEKPSDFEQIAYPFGFWMFVILMVLMLFAGIYQEYLMSPEKREKMLLDALKKIQEKKDA